MNYAAPRTGSPLCSCTDSRFHISSSIQRSAFWSTPASRVLRYDLFGRGFSDRPHVQYNIDLFVNQLRELLDAFNIKQVNVIGLSMGGAIAATFTVSFPRRVGRLVLMDSIGTHPIPLSWMYKAALLPGISELILGLAGTERIVRRAASDFFNPEHVKVFENQYRIQMQYHGFKRGLLSTLRNKTVDGILEVYQRLGNLDMPVLLIWGQDDRTLPLEQSRGILSAVPRAEFHLIENCGHIPHYEKPKEVNPIIQQFLNSK